MSTPDGDRESIVRRLRGSQWVLVLLLLLIIFISTPLVAAQIQGVFEDDFEDGDADGWKNVAENVSADISTDSVEGDYSMTASATMIGSPDNPSFDWVDGPELDLQENFTIVGTMKYTVADPSAGRPTTRIGITGSDQAETGENVYLLFDYGDGETRLGTSFDDDSGESINNDFQDQWVRFKIQSSEGDGELRAKAWDYNNTEPSNWQITRSGFEGESGLFGVNPGDNPNTGRQIWLDSVEIEGEEVEVETDQNISIESRLFLEHGQSAPYSVVYESTNDNNNRTTREVITNESTVSSGNTSVVTVNQEGQEIVATNDTSVNNRTFITAEYTTGGETYTAQRNVTVANLTVENLGILPPVSRFSASITDTNMQVIIIATAAGAAASIIATAFAGVAAMTMVMMMGWIAGYVGNGMAMVTVFICLFVSLNVAGNVDYTVRR